MKRTAILLLIAVAVLGSCSCNASKKTDNGSEHKCCEDKQITKLTREEIKTRSFDELFDTIDVRNIKEDVFTLVGEDYGILIGRAHV